MEYSQPRANPLLVLIVMVVSLTIGIVSFTYIPLEIIFALMGLMLMVSFLVKTPRLGLYATILLLPLFWTGIFETRLIGISGLKISVVLPLVSFLFLFFVIKSRKIQGTDQAFFAVLIALLTVAVIRCYPYLKQYTAMMGEELTVFRLFSTYLLRPLLIFLIVPFLASYLQTEKDLNQAAKVIITSAVVAFGLIVYALFQVPFTNYEDFRSELQTICGMHAGYYANYLLCLIPLTLCLAIKKHWKICYFILAIEVVGVALTFSRASYGVAVVSILIVFIVCKKGQIVFGIVIASPIMISLVPSLFLERALSGVAEKDIAVISAGRIDSIWKPLLQEFSQKPRLLLLGNGRYGMLNTTCYHSGASYRVNNAHNILLDSICDGGIIVLFFFVIFFIHYLKKFYLTTKQTQNPLYQSILWGAILGIAGFITKGTTDGVFWPESSNAMIYVLLGLGIAVVYRDQEGLHHIAR